MPEPIFYIEMSQDQQNFLRKNTHLWPVARLHGADLYILVTDVETDYSYILTPDCRVVSVIRFFGVTGRRNQFDYVRVV